MKGLKITLMGLGTAGMGNLYIKISQDKANEMARYAIEQGLNFFDTKRHRRLYGRHPEHRYPGNRGSSGAKYRYREASPEITAKVARIVAVCRRYDVPLNAALCCLTPGPVRNIPNLCGLIYRLSRRIQPSFKATRIV